MARGTISKRTVDALKLGETLFDSEFAGFFIRVRKNAKVYGLKYVHEGRQRLFTIGKHGRLTPDEARREAKKLTGAIANNQDPQGQKLERRERDTRTFEELATRYLERYARIEKKPRSVIEDERLLRLHLLPALAKRPLGSITKFDFVAMRDRMTEIQVSFNRTRALAHTMFELAIEWGCMQTNPAKTVRRYPEHPVERLISNEEYRRLFEALGDGRENPIAIACIKILALTGCRLSEIRDLRWDWVDLAAGTLNLPDSKTGKRTIALGAPALELLSGLERVSSYVCPGADLLKPLVGIQKPWRRIRKAAGLDDVVIHTLRHSLASLAAASGESVVLIQAALGHRSVRTTEGYMHLATDPVRAVLDRVASRIAAAGEGRTADVVPIRRPG